MSKLQNTFKPFRSLYVAIVISLYTITVAGQPVERHIRTTEYKELQKSLGTGWNTWYNNSVITEVLLPEKFAISLCLANNNSPDYLKEVLPATAILNRPEKVTYGLRSDDGSYTSLKVTYKDNTFDVQTGTDGVDFYMLVTPEKSADTYLVVEAGILWGGTGTVGATANSLIGNFGDQQLNVYFTKAPVAASYAASTAPHITLSLSGEVGICSGKQRNIATIKAFIKQHRALQEKRIKSYGDLAESFQAMQTVLAWNTIYDAPNKRVITPVSRLWNYRWGAGYVLFNWDTYFASYMLSLYNKKLAYANAIEITKAITSEGFVPNFQSASRGSSLDRSQPPIGSTIILNIYRHYGDKWFLKEVYDELLTWNRWWPKNRSIDGYISWGSYDPKTKAVSQTFSKYESGLDNSPMFDHIPIDSATHTLKLADVGLLSMYTMDCQSLAAIAIALGKTADAAELTKRANYYKAKLETLWDDSAAIYRNKRLDNGELSPRLSPTNFYPMLAGVPTADQAARMIKEHLLNDKEFYGDYMIPSVPKNDPAFKDNNYWRGRIWGPLNMLVYMGLRNYNTADVRADLVQKSKKLFLQTWRANGSVYENYNAVTGDGGDVPNADSSYHWGALLVFMEFLEKGYIK